MSLCSEAARPLGVVLDPGFAVIEFATTEAAVDKLVDILDVLVLVLPTAGFEPGFADDEDGLG